MASRTRSTALHSFLIHPAIIARPTALTAIITPFSQVNKQLAQPTDAGTYRFTVYADDGVRLWVDDRLLIDQWQHPQVATYSAEVSLAQGYHRVRLVTGDHALGD